MSDKVPPERLSVGVAGLDEMLGGGIPSGYSVLVAGPLTTRTGMWSPTPDYLGVNPAHFRH